MRAREKIHATNAGRLALFAFVLASSGALGCSPTRDGVASKSERGKSTGAPDGAIPDDGGGAMAEPGLHEENGVLVFRTERFTVEPGTERYLCSTATTNQALKISSIDFGGSSGVHHLTFAKTAAPEPAGLSECNTLLKTTWLPLFSAGAGANRLSLPEGVAHELAAGTQLLMQMHLQNTTTDAVTKQVELALSLTDEPDTQAVQIGGFGSFQISLPPGRTSSITHECSLPSDARIVAMIPHMHQLATSMTLDLGPSGHDLKRIYTRDPWDFSQQTIDNVDMTLAAGQFARVTCNYDNHTDKTVSYGESTLDEMCFLGVFSLGSQITCIQF